MEPSVPLLIVVPAEEARERTVLVTREGTPVCHPLS